MMIDKNALHMPRFPAAFLAVLMIGFLSMDHQDVREKTLAVLSLNPDNPEHAQGLYFTRYSIGWLDSSRQIGCSVRPVTE